MNKPAVVFGLFLLASMAFSQSDRGSITGTVSDPAGGVVPAAAIEARNVETGVMYNGATSATGCHSRAHRRAAPRGSAGPCRRSGVGSGVVVAAAGPGVAGRRCPRRAGPPVRPTRLAAL